jgi:type II secretory pathway pseudopilin PulG
MHRLITTTHRPQGGIALLELLLAMGLVNLLLAAAYIVQQRAAQAAQLGLQQRQASLLLEQIALTLREYPQQLAELHLSATSLQVAADCGTGHYCTAGQMLAYWHQHWQKALQQLPLANIQVSCQTRCSAGQQLELKLSWQSRLLPPAGGCGELERYCLSVYVRL